MNFHDTTLGVRFFQGQLPQLINALNAISQKLSPPVQAIQIQTENYDDFLAELYHGNYDPSDIPDTAAQADCTKQIMAFQEKLRAELPSGAWDQVEYYRILLEDRHCEDREQAFASGFRCAMTMLAAGLSTQRRDEK